MTQRGKESTFSPLKKRYVCFLEKCSESFSEMFREIFGNVPRDFWKCSERFSVKRK